MRTAWVTCSTTATRLGVGLGIGLGVGVGVGAPNPNPKPNPNPNPNPNPISNPIPKPYPNPNKEEYVSEDDTLGLGVSRIADLCAAEGAPLAGTSLGGIAPPVVKMPPGTMCPTGGAQVFYEGRGGGRRLAQKKKTTTTCAKPGGAIAQTTYKTDPFAAQAPSKKLGTQVLDFRLDDDCGNEVPLAWTGDRLEILLPYLPNQPANEEERRLLAHLEASVTLDCISPPPSLPPPSSPPPSPPPSPPSSATSSASTAATWLCCSLVSCSRRRRSAVSGQG